MVIPAKGGPAGDLNVPLSVCNMIIPAKGGTGDLNVPLSEAQLPEVLGRWLLLDGWASEG